MNDTKDDEAKPRRKVVVIVDDEPEQVQGISLALRSFGWEVRHAESGNVGLAIIATDKPDLVLLDLGMKGRNGFMILEYLRAHDISTSKIIVVTGMDGERHQEYVMTLGAHAFFLKPYTVDQVASKAKEILNG